MKKELNELETVLENDIENSLNSSFGVDIKSDKDLKEIMCKIKVGLVSDDWEKINQNLQKLRGVMTNVKDKPENFQKLLKTLDFELNKALSDPRSQVVREASITISYLSMNLGNKFELQVISLLEALMNLVPNGVKVMSTSGKTALKTIINNIQGQKLFAKIAYILKNSKSTLVRQFCCEILSILCENWNCNIIDIFSGELCEMIKKGINDADEQARAFSRNSYFSLQKRLPKLAENIFKSLDNSKQKSLMKNNNSSSLSSNIKGKSMIVERLAAVKSSSDNKENINKRSESYNKATNKCIIRKLSQQGTPMKSIFESSVSLNENIHISTSTVNSELKHAIPEEITSFNGLIKKLKSESHTERIDGLDRLETFMSHTTFQQSELKSLINIFDIFLLDNQSKVLIKYLSVLYIFIEQYHPQIIDWLGRLFPKLLNFHSNRNLKTISEATDKLLNMILTRLGSKFVFIECCKILSSRNDQLSSKAQLVILDCLNKSITEIRNFLFEIEATNFGDAIEKLLLWSENTRSQELRISANNVLWKIFTTDNNKLLEHLLSMLLSESAKIRAMHIIDNDSYRLKPQGKIDNPIKYTPNRTRIPSRTPSSIKLETQTTTTTLSIGKRLTGNPLKSKFSITENDLLSNSFGNIDLNWRNESIGNLTELENLFKSIELNLDNEIELAHSVIEIENLIGCYSSNQLEHEMTTWCSLMLKLVGHNSSKVRKQTVLCLGKMCTIIGDRLFQILNLPTATVKLTKRYMEINKL